LPLTLLLAGCLGARPAVTVDQYSLDYQAPAFPGLAPLAAGIKVARFSAAQELAGNDMLHQPGPYQRQAYAYHRWRVSPADLVTDHLARDLRLSGIFALVLSYHDPSSARFKLEGAVEEFMQKDLPAGPTASLTLGVTLLDISHRDLPSRLLYQKVYDMEVPLAEPGPLALAQGLSRAMAQLSPRIIRDAHQAASQRLAQ
jgi:ABC-type uncharacterized transport system auxiliary subunit